MKINAVTMQAVPEQEAELILVPDYSTTDRKPRPAAEVAEYFTELFQMAHLKGVDLVAVPWGWLQDAARELAALSHPTPPAANCGEESAK